MGNWVDDRPPQFPGKDEWVQTLNRLAADLIAKYPEPVAAHTQLDLFKENPDVS